MNKAYVLAASTCLLAAPSMAQVGGTQVWHGTVTIGRVNQPACGGWFKSSMTGSSAYVPQLQSTDGPTGLTMMFSHSALAVVNLTGDALMRGAGTADATGLGSNESLSIRGEKKPIQYFNFVIAPAHITASTPVITIKGNLAFVPPGFVGTCDFAFAATYGAFPATPVEIPNP